MRRRFLLLLVLCLGILTACGEMKNGKVENKELTIYLDGQRRDGIYTGELKAGRPNGEGIFETENDEKSKWKYTGQWKNGVMHGVGECLWDTGQYFEGRYVDGKPGREGLLKWINKETKKQWTYEGEFQEGSYAMFEGQGKLYKEGRLVYEGVFKNGEFNGEGKYYEGDKMYEGVFVDGTLNGEGKCYEQNELIYEGTFENGKCIFINREKTFDFGNNKQGFIKWGKYGFRVPKLWKIETKKKDSIVFIPNNDEEARVSVTYSEKVDLSKEDVRKKVKMEHVKNRLLLLEGDDYRLNEEGTEEKSYLRRNRYCIHLFIYNENNLISEEYAYFYTRDDNTFLVTTELGNSKYDYSKDAERVIESLLDWQMAEIKMEVEQEMEESRKFN